MTAPHDEYTQAYTTHDFARKRPLIRWALIVAKQLLARHTSIVHEVRVFEPVALDNRGDNSTAGVLVITTANARDEWLRVLTANTDRHNNAADRYNSAIYVLDAAWLDDLLPSIAAGIDFVLVTPEELADADELVVQSRCSNLPGLADIRWTAINALLYGTV